MLGSTTAPGHPGARDDAPVHVAFRSMHSVGVPGVVFSRLNTQPMRTPVNASPSPSRGPTHDSGTVWFATPSLEETRTLYSLPVSRRTHCHINERSPPSLLPVPDFGAGQQARLTFPDPEPPATDPQSIPSRLKLTMPRGPWSDGARTS
jgi:hypothetical protein